MAGRHALHRARARRLHGAVRHAPPRHHRAPRGHGGGDRLRVGGQAARLPRGRHLRHLLALRRLRRPLRARLGGARAATPARLRRRRPARLRRLVRPRAAGDAVDHLPAAAVPDRGGGERQRAAPAPRHLGLPGLPAGDQHLCDPDRHRRPAAFRQRHGGPGHLRADPAARAWAECARLARVHRRPVGGHRHGHRGGDRAVHDGVQRPRDADAAAQPPARPRARARPHRAPARHPPRRDRGAAAARLSLLPPRRRGLRAGQHRPHQLRRGGAVRPGGDRRHVLAWRHPRGRARRPARGLRGVGLHAAAAVVRQVGLARSGLPRARRARPRLAQARAALRAHRPGQHQPRAVLEPPRQHRLLRRGVDAARADRARGHPGRALRRCVPAW